MGKLEVHVMAARNLPDIQMFSKIDPYVKVEFNNQTFETEFIENTTDPEWNARFVFQVADEHSGQIDFKIYNKNTMSDDYLGEYSLSLAGLVRGQRKDDWYIVKNCKSNAEIQIGLLAVDFGKVEGVAGMLQGLGNMLS